MNEQALRVLLVDDERSVREPLAEHLQRRFGYMVTPIATFVDAIDAVKAAKAARQPFHVALLDDIIAEKQGEEPRRLGIRLMKEIRALSPDTEFILFTGWGMEDGIEAMRAGAHRYIRKPFDLEELGILIQHAAEYRRIKQEKYWLQTFLEIGKATSSKLDLKQVLEEVHRQVGKVLDTSSMDVVLYDRENQQLHFVFGFDGGEKEEAWQRPFTPGKGLIEWVITHRTSLLIKDFRVEAPPVEPYQEGWSAQSWLGAPLVVRDEVIGAITVQSWEPNRFDETHREILAAVASQVAIAIANARLFKEKETYARQLEEVRKAALDLGDLTQEAPLLEEIVKKAVALLNARSGGVYAYNPMAGELKIVADYSRGANVVGKVLRVGEGMAGRLVESNEAYMTVDDYGKWPYRAEIFTEPRPFGAVIEVPLKWHNRLVGVLFVEDEVGRRFGSKEARLLQLFAEHAAHALVNVRLLQQSEEARERLLRSFEASMALIQEDDPQKLLKAIMERVKDVAEAAWVSIIIIDEKGRSREMLEDKGLYRMEDVMQPEGYSMQVFRTGIPVVISDVTQDDRANPIMKENHIRSALCLPFSVRGERIGVMWLHFDHPRSFPDYEIDILQRYANQAAIAYDNARRVATLEHMRQAAKALAGAESLDVVLKTIVKSATEVLQAQSAAIWSYDAHRKRFVPEESVTYGIEEDIWQEFLKNDPKPGQTAQTVMKEGWIGVEDIEDEEQYAFLGETTRKSLKRIGVRSFQGIRLVAGEEQLGLLYVNYERTRSFTEEDKQTIFTFANHVALALKKARLHHLLEEAYEEAEKVAEMMTLADVDATLRSVMAGARTVLDADAIVLYIYDEDRNRFDYPPVVDGVRHPERIWRFNSVDPQSIVFKVLEGSKPYAVEDMKNHEDYRGGRFANEEEIKSFIAVPLKVTKEGKHHPVGVMLINFRHPRHFDEEQKRRIQLFVNQAAVAIFDAQLYERLQKRITALKSIQKVSAVITAELDVNKVMRKIAEESSRVFADLPTSVMLWDESGDNLVIKAACGLDPTLQAQQKIPHRVVDEFLGGNELTPQIFPIGTQALGEQELVNQAGLHSVLTALLVDTDGALIGVLNIYSDSEEIQFSEQDKELASIFANQASIAIQNAKRYEELKAIKGYVGAHTALEWMKMVGLSWGHKVRGKVGNARGRLWLVRDALQRKERFDKIMQELDQLDQAIADIAKVPITAPLTADEGVEAIPVNSFLSRYVRKWQRDRDLAHTTFIFAPDPRADAKNITIRASKAWLSRALDILVDNAIRAIHDAGVTDGKIKIAWFLKDNRVHISVANNGPTIPPDVRQKLFKQPIRHSQASDRAGVGLLEALAIVHTYGGEIWLEPESELNVEFVMTFPRQ